MNKCMKIYLKDTEMNMMALFRAERRILNIIKHHISVQQAAINDTCVTPDDFLLSIPEIHGVEDDDFQQDDDVFQLHNVFMIHQNIFSKQNPGAEDIAEDCIESEYLKR